MEVNYLDDCEDLVIGEVVQNVPTWCPLVLGIYKLNFDVSYCKG